MGVDMWLDWRTSLLVVSLTAAIQAATVGEFPLLMPKVTPTLAETYLCTPIRMDTEDTYYIVGFKPNATKMTAHHMLIYGCEEPGDNNPTWNCGEMAVKEPGLESHPVCASGSQVIYAWAMDAPDLHLPEGDGSGVVLEYTEQEQPKTAGILLMGTGGSAPGL